MPRPKKIEKVMEDAENAPLPPDEMPLETLKDYIAYNEAARKANKRLRRCEYPAKPAPLELHPHQRVIVRWSNKTRAGNPIPIKLSDSLIDFDKTLDPGKEYDLPVCVVSHLEGKGTDVYEWVDKADGSSETAVVDKLPRYSVQTVHRQAM